MTRRYSIAKARSSLRTIVDQAEAGQEIELTRRGKPVVVVLSLNELERLRGARPQFGATYRRFLTAHPVEEYGLDENDVAGLRDTDAGRKVVL
jgi:prevent-host-death family protein